MKIPTHSSSPTKAFTLVELLTVIAIIGILAAILIPVIGKVRQSARTSTCASNLRQIGVATLAFTAEHKNWLPGGYEKTGQWNLYGMGRSAGPQGWLENGKATQTLAAQLFPYLIGSQPNVSNTELPQNKVFLCPANSDAASVFGTSSAIASYQCGTGVKLNNGTIVRPFGKSTGTRAPNLMDVANPGAAVALFDLDRGFLAELTDPVPTVGPLTAADVHGTVRNFLFLDGHVAAMPLDFKPLFVAW
jgi:prepilin-type N-terminal cleavage/methylation domain-containing protein/prepilin-type processing-associated H-X9-DG protein